MDEPSNRATVGTFDLLRRWTAYLEVSGRCNANTRRQYRRALVAVCADLVLGLEQLTEDDLIAYVASLDPRGGMRAQVLKALHSFYSWAERRQVLPINPVRALPIPRAKYGRAPTLERPDRERLFAAAEQIDPRARPALELMFATGARIGSLCGIRPEDVLSGKSGNRWVHFAVAKDNRPYDVPLNALGAAAVDQLLELATYRPPRVRSRLPTLVGVEPSTVWTWMHRACEIAGVRAWPHLLRHAFATELADVDDRTWAELMNHRDASLRRRYADRRDDRMEAAVQTVH